MIPLVLAACVRTPPHPDWPEAVTVRAELREQVVDETGRGCSWEEESLWVGDRRLVGESPPDSEDWCREPSAHWRTLDVVAQDGAFVSIVTESSSGAPTCGTLDLATGQSATLAAYDERHAERRIRWATRLLTRLPRPPGFDPDRFLVRDGHVRFCWIDPTGARHDLDVP